MNSFAGKFQIFDYIGKQVRVIYKENATGELEPWFVLNDLCDVLDIINSRDIRKRIRGHT